jgi:hypothetical protein
MADEKSIISWLIEIVKILHVIVTERMKCGFTFNGIRLESRNSKSRQYVISTL